MDFFSLFSKRMLVAVKRNYRVLKEEKYCTDICIFTKNLHINLVVYYHVNPLHYAVHLNLFLILPKLKNNKKITLSQKKREIFLVYFSGSGEINC